MYNVTTFNPSGSSSSLRVSEYMATAALVALYADEKGNGARARIEAVFTIVVRIKEHR